MTNADTIMDGAARVHICAKCGAGFPEWSPLLHKRVHDNPVWNTTEVYEDICYGRVIEVFRASQIERCKWEEFYSGEQCMRKGS